MKPDHQRLKQASVEMVRVMKQLASPSQSPVLAFWVAIVAYVVVLVVSILLIIASPPAAWWRIPLALAPVVPIIFAVLAFMRIFGRMDELQRRIQLEALAFSFAITGVVTFSYGCLVYVGFPAISWVYIFPLMIALWGVGQAIAKRRYQ